MILLLQIVWEGSCSRGLFWSSCAKLVNVTFTLHLSSHWKKVPSSYKDHQQEPVNHQVAHPALEQVQGNSLELYCARGGVGSG